MVRNLVPHGDGGMDCRIYPVRPRQCRTWPFWPVNLSSPETWALAAGRCPGINRGRIVLFEQVEAKRNATSG